MNPCTHNWSRINERKIYTNTTESRDQSPIVPWTELNKTSFTTNVMLICSQFIFIIHTILGVAKVEMKKTLKRLSSTHIRWKRSKKTELFENALQSGTFWKRCFRVHVWRDENGTFRKSWGHTISSNPLRAILKTYSRWRKGASLSCLLYLSSFLT